MSEVELRHLDTPQLITQINQAYERMNEARREWNMLCGLLEQRSNRNTEPPLDEIAQGGGGW